MQVLDDGDLNQKDGHLMGFLSERRLAAERCREAITAEERAAAGDEVARLTAEMHASIDAYGRTTTTVASLGHAGPRYEHDCDLCAFLGRYQWGHQDYDLYSHDRGDRTELLARYASAGPAYLSIGAQTIEAGAYEAMSPLVAAYHRHLAHIWLAAPAAEEAPITPARS